MIEFIMIVIGAVIGSIVTFLLPNREVNRLRAQLAGAEARESEYRRKSAVNVRGRVHEDDPDHQLPLLESNEEIEVQQLDYCTDTGARVESQTFDAAHRGHTVALPVLGQEGLVRLQAVKYDGRTGTAEVRLRVLYRALGENREVEIPARLVQAHRDAQGLKCYLKLTG